YSVALQLSRDTLALALKQSQAENLYTIWARTVLGETLMRQNLAANAENVLRDAYPNGRHVGGTESQAMAARACVDLARALVMQGKRDEAIGILADGLEHGLQLPIAALLAKDPGLWQLRDNPRIQAILGTTETRAGAKVERKAP